MVCDSRFTDRVGLFLCEVRDTGGIVVQLAKEYCIAA